jgi:hypothetical protein
MRPKAAHFFAGSFSVFTTNSLSLSPRFSFLMTLNPTLATEESHQLILINLLVSEKKQEKWRKGEISSQKSTIAIFSYCKCMHEID